MATNHTSSGKGSKPAERKNGVSAPGAASVAAQAATPAPAPETRVEEPVVAATLPAPVTEIAVAFKAETLDAAEWTQKSFEFWAESTSAFFDFAERVGKARTLEEIATLQSTFASERLDSLLRQSKEMMTLAQGYMSIAAPFCGARAA